jgi:hypothetical protein
MPKPKRQRPRDANTASAGLPAPEAADQKTAEGAPRVPEGLQPRGRNAEMGEMLRKMTGRPEFNVVNIEKAVAARLAARKTSKG